ncbi:MAG: CBS domain-containing protein [Acidobacteriota bacterium]
MRVSEVMTGKVQTVDQHERIERARTLMRLRGIHHLVVVEGLRIVGLVSSEMLDRGEAEGIAHVEDIMLRHVLVASPELTITRAAKLLRGRTAGALPVVAHDRLVGIVTVSDLLDLIGRGAAQPVATSRRRTLKVPGKKPRVVVAAADPHR